MSAVTNSEEKVVVFGGSGFLGSHVADALSEAGYPVRIFDITPSPYLRSDQEMLIGDMLDAETAIRAAEGCAYVYNFAGLADIDDAKNRPIDTVQLNVLGNVHCLEAARIAGAKRFIFASTVYVYSESGSFYRASKQASERFIEAYQERYGLDYTILRYGSLYGRRADFRNGIYRLVRQALQEKRIADLARDMIRLSGFSEDDIKIEFTGLRPGEKLYEELLTDSEQTIATPHPKLRVASAEAAPAASWAESLELWLNQSAPASSNELKLILQKFVPEYSPQLQ